MLATQPQIDWTVIRCQVQVARTGVRSQRRHMRGATWASCSPRHKIPSHLGTRTVTRWPCSGWANRHATSHGIPAQNPGLPVCTRRPRDKANPCSAHTRSWSRHPRSLRRYKRGATTWASHSPTAPTYRRVVRYGLCYPMIRSVLPPLFFLLLLTTFNFCLPQHFATYMYLLYTPADGSRALKLCYFDLSNLYVCDRALAP
jgi:hypothetical protein